jgi:hypothetical protein
MTRVIRVAIFGNYFEGGWLVKKRVTEKPLDGAGTDENL